MLIDTIFKFVDYIDEKTFNIIPPLSVRGKLLEQTGGIPESAQNNLILTKGRYDLTFAPINEMVFDFSSEVIDLKVFKEAGYEGKRIRIVSMVANPQSLRITVDLLDNPIPLFVISAVILAFAVSITALSSSSLLTKVERVFVTPTMSILSIAGLVGLGLIFFKKVKRK